MSISWLLAMISSFGVAAFLLLSRVWYKSWLTPVGVLAGTWLLAMLLPLVIAADYPIYPGAYLFILLAIIISFLAHAAGSATGGNLIYRKPYGPQFVRTLSPHAGPFYAGLVLLGAFAPVVTYGSVVSTFNAYDLVGFINAATAARYTGDFRTPFAAVILQALLYAAAQVSGLRMGSLKTQSLSVTIWNIAWFFPLLVSSIVLTQRALVLFGIVLWFSGWLVGAAWVGRIRKISGRTLALILFFSVVGAYFFSVAVQMLRAGHFDHFTRVYAQERVRGYFAGHMAGFGNWFSAQPGEGVSLGTNTFSGLAAILGIKPREIGLYQEYIELPSGYANIYTAWRPLLEDFGLMGSLLVIAAASFLCGIGWRAVSRGETMAGGVFVIPFVAYSLFSPIASIFSYNSILMSFMLSAIILTVSGKMIASEKQRG